MNLPPLARVRQSIPQPRLEDVPGTVRRLIQSSKLAERVTQGRHDRRRHWKPRR